MQGARRTFAFSSMFLLSGAAGVLFETLWFRLAGLSFGSSAWATAIVLASFMAGLATGNLLAPRLVAGRHPLRVYGAIELGIAASGLLLVFVLPLTASLFAPLFRGLGDHAILLNAARLTIAFILLAIPSTLMGATLPAVVSALSSSQPDFARVLGMLYGWNTLGATAGALAGEMFLIRALGIRGTAIFAADLDLIAGVAAFMIARSDHVEVARSEVRVRLSSPALRLIIAAGLCGFTLLALEVLWFRFMSMFIFGSSLAFAVMLATVLAGIGIGALIAARVRPAIPVVASLAAIAVSLSYRFFQPMEKIGRDYFVRRETAAVIAGSARLMLPVAIVSGLLFTLIGQRLRQELRDDTRTTSLLTFGNTIGAAAGPIVAAFLLIPAIGVERSFVALIIIYGLVAFLTGRVSERSSLVAPAIVVVALLLFPFGAMRSRFVPQSAAEYLNADTRLEVLREGPIETAAFLRTDFAGQPYARRLFTNGFSMSATTFVCRRYMSEFAYLPLALRPNARTALLISYGVGVTARALADSHEIKSIDVVDISRNILDLSEVAWPRQANPLRDPRVHAHVEDGRFFLLTTDRRFDVITAEPPPPKNAGVVSLYSLEYFRLLRDRLSDDGMATYWLPVYQLSDSDTKALLAAFCGAFEDCSLWSGAGREWILAGSRGTANAPSYAQFAKPWSDPTTGPALRRAGFEVPEQVAATFIADADALREYVGNATPLTDDRPLRLSPDLVREPSSLIVETLGPSAARSFATSRYIRHSLPAELQQRTPDWFATQSVLDNLLSEEREVGAMAPPETIRSLLTTTQLRTFPRLLLRSNPWLEDAARAALAHGDRTGDAFRVVGIGALCDREYIRARELLSEAVRAGSRDAEPLEKLAAELANTQQR